MIAVPFQISQDTWSVFIVLEDENIERIKQYDPAEFSVAKANMHGKIRDVVIGYATSEEVQELQACRDKEQVQKVLQKLSRGFAFRPDLGDHDNPYESLKAKG